MLNNRTAGPKTKHPNLKVVLLYHITQGPHLEMICCFKWLCQLSAVWSTNSAPSMCILVKVIVDHIKVRKGEIRGTVEANI